jgi:uncharacterized protein
MQPHDNIDFAYHFDGRGRTASADDTRHVRNLIEQVLLTAPGERVMRPDFGSGLLALLFEPNSSTLAATTQVLVQGALQQHLGHLIAVRSVEVTPDDGALRVDVSYALLADGTAQRASFSVPGAAP